MLLGWFVLGSVHAGAHTATAANARPTFDYGLVPVAVAVMVALGWRPLLIGTGPLFPFAGAVPPGSSLLLLALGVGVLIGLLAVVLSALLYRVEDAFHLLPVHWMWWPGILPPRPKLPCAPPLPMPGRCWKKPVLRRAHHRPA